MANLSEEKWVREELEFTTTIVQGSKGRAVERVQEWVTFHGFGTAVDSDYGPASAKAVKAFQGAKGLDVTGSVDKQTFTQLTRPMRDTLAIINPPPTGLSEAIVAYARQHLAQHPIEIGGANEGPWVRFYMRGKEGQAFLWCAGFACTVIRQASEALQQNTSVAFTMSCDSLAQAAKAQERFLSGRSVVGNPSDAAKIQPGSLFLIQNKNNQNDYIHTGLVIAADHDSFTTIEGNTNQEGGSNGFEVCRRERGYARADFYVVSDARQ